MDNHKRQVQHTAADFHKFDIVARLQRAHYEYWARIHGYVPDVPGVSSVHK